MYQRNIIWFAAIYWLMLAIMPAQGQSMPVEPTQTIITPRKLDNVFMNRVDSVRGQDTLTTAVITPHLEIFALGWNTPTAKDFEVGKLFPISKNWSAGGYLVSWPDSNKYFLLPWINYHDHIGNWKFSADLVRYLPLNQGPSIFFTNEASAIVPMGKRMDIGVVFSFFQKNNGPAPIRLGPTLRWHDGKIAIKLNYQPEALSFHGRAPSKLRLQLSLFY
jgi:hypothetical protein